MTEWYLEIHDSPIVEHSIRLSLTLRVELFLPHWIKAPLDIYSIKGEREFLIEKKLCVPNIKNRAESGSLSYLRAISFAQHRRHTYSTHTVQLSRRQNCRSWKKFLIKLTLPYSTHSPPSRFAWVCSSLHVQAFLSTLNTGLSSYFWKRYKIFKAATKRCPLDWMGRGVVWMICWMLCASLQLFSALRQTNVRQS